MQYSNIGNERAPPAGRGNSMASSQFVGSFNQQKAGSQSNHRHEKLEFQKYSPKNFSLKPSFLGGTKPETISQSMIFESGSAKFSTMAPGTLQRMAKLSRGSVQSSPLNNQAPLSKSQTINKIGSSDGNGAIGKKFKSPLSFDRVDQQSETSSMVQKNFSIRGRVDSKIHSNKQPFSPAGLKRKSMANKSSFNFQEIKKSSFLNQQMIPKKQDEQSTHSTTEKCAYKVPQFLKKGSQLSEQKEGLQNSRNKSTTMFNVQKVDCEQPSAYPEKGQARTFGFNNIVQNPKSFSRKKINEAISGSFTKKTNTPQSYPCKPELPNFQLGRLSSPSAFNKGKRVQAARELKLRDFQLLDKIGKGAFGDVYIAQDIKTGFMCVLKKVSKKKIKEQKLEEHILREIKIQAYLRHKHITQIFGVFSEDDHLYLILELLPDGAMSYVKKKKKMPECQTSRYIRQVCEGLRFMHKEDIIHRDLKPQNVFMNEDYIKIGDFGCAVYTQTMRNTIVGCLAYISPEQLNKMSYDDKIDVWSVGILTFEMLTGKAPFENDIIKISQQYEQPFLPNLCFPADIPLSDDAKHFMLSLLAAKPEERISLDEAMKHPFICKQFQQDRKAEQEISAKFQLLWKTQP